MTAPEPRYDAALRLLDRQLVDPDGRPVGKVDDLEVTAGPDGVLTLTALLTGPGAVGPRLGGRLGRWTVSAWRRLRADSSAQPARISAADVVEIASAVRLSRRDDGRQGLERWLLSHVVGRLPGSGAGPQVEDDVVAPTPPLDLVHRLGTLLGAPVVAAGGGPLGHLNDVRLAPGRGVTGLHAPPRVVGLIVSDRHAGSLLGYDRRADQGPWLVRVVVRRLHRKACYLPWGAVVRIDWTEPRVTVDAARREAL